MVAPLNRAYPKAPPMPPRDPVDESYAKARARREAALADIAEHHLRTITAKAGDSAEGEAEFVELRLPADVVEVMRKTAAATGVGFDELCAAALARDIDQSFRHAGMDDTLDAAQPIPAPEVIEGDRRAGVTLAATGYESLADVLAAAFRQASAGKGSERHGQGQPFAGQPMQQLIKLYGLGFALGQAAKKSQEAQRLPRERAVAELLGAINYLAGAVIALELGTVSTTPKE